MVTRIESRHPKGARENMAKSISPELEEVMKAAVGSSVEPSEAAKLAALMICDGEDRVRLGDPNKFTGTQPGWGKVSLARIIDAALADERRRTLVLLWEIQWAHGEHYDKCPKCQRVNPNSIRAAFSSIRGFTGHAPDCELAALIAELERTVPNG